MIKLQKILNELGIDNPKRYCLTQKGIEVINDVNILQKLLEKYDFSLSELENSEEWVISDMLNSWYGFDPLSNKIKLSKDEIMQNLEKMDKSTANDMFENMDTYIDGYIEFK